MGKLLIDERPLTVLPSLVKAVGMERAVILQQIHWLSQMPNGGIEHDGEHWVWGKYEEWCADYFPFWGADTLRKHIVKLEKDSYLFSVQIRGFDRTKAYRINAEKIAAIESANRHDHATSKRKKIRPANRHDDAGSKREDHADWKREDHADWKREDHADWKREDHADWKREDHADSYIKTTTETTNQTTTEKDEDEAHARAAVDRAWAEHYSDPIPEKISGPIDALIDECGAAAVIHGVIAAAEANARSFAYIAKCARNYVPAPPATNGKSYSVDLPGVYRFEPPAQAAAPAKAEPAPLTNDPLREIVADLCRAYPDTRAAEWLEGSRLVEAGELAGIPLYRIVVKDPDSVSWLTNRMGVLLRRSLSVQLKRRVLIEIVAAESEPEPVAEVEPTP